MTKILITEPEYFPQESRSLLGSIGDVVAKRMGRMEMLRELNDTDILVVRIETMVDREALDSAPKLKIIASATTGLNHIDVEHAKGRGIEVISLSGKHTIPTAEHTFALIFGLARRIRLAHSHVMEGKWERYKFLGVQLSNKTFGIIGLGRIGSHVSKYANAFGMNVIAYDPYVTEEHAKRAGARLTDLGSLLRESDVISIHAMLTEETKGMIGEKELRKMKPSALLINDARGEIINKEPLVDALENGIISGAAIDVFDKEPVDKDDALIRYAKSHDNLLLTPHLGASTIDAVNEVSVHIANEVIKSYMRK